MLPLLFLIPGAWLLWSLARKHRGHHVSGPQSSPLFRESHRSPPRGFLRSREEVVTTADYLRHLYEATALARVLDTVKDVALAADVSALMHSPPEIARALDALAAPMGVIFAQKDLNVLGASPPLPEDGIMGPSTRAAIRALQTRFGQPSSGELDGPTTVAIRYSVGCIHAQDLG